MSVPGLIVVAITSTRASISSARARKAGGTTCFRFMSSKIDGSASAGSASVTGAPAGGSAAPSLRPAGGPAPGGAVGAAAGGTTAPSSRPGTCTPKTPSTSPSASVAPSSPGLLWMVTSSASSASRVGSCARITSADTNASESRSRWASVIRFWFGPVKSLRAVACSVSRKSCIASREPPTWLELLPSLILSTMGSRVTASIFSSRPSPVA